MGDHKNELHADFYFAFFVVAEVVFSLTCDIEWTAKCKNKLKKKLRTRGRVIKNGEIGKNLYLLTTIRHAAEAFCVPVYLC